jgi:hypothetical protein
MKTLQKDEYGFTEPDYDNGIEVDNEIKYEVQKAYGSYKFITDAEYKKMAERIVEMELELQRYPYTKLVIKPKPSTIITSIIKPEVTPITKLTAKTITKLPLEIAKTKEPTIPTTTLEKTPTTTKTTFTTIPTIPTTPTLTPILTTPTPIPTPPMTTTTLPPTPPIITPPTTKKPPVLPPFSKKVSFDDLTLAQKEASVAWKQGWAYHLIYPPWNAQNVLHSKKPFPNVKVSSGPGSARESVAIVHGEDLPEKIQWDLGVYDITFQKGLKNKVGMVYKSDPKDKNKLRGASGMPQAKRIRRRTVTPIFSGFM